MILQYVLIGKECYCEADCISLQTVSLKEIEEKTLNNVIEKAVGEFPFLIGSTIIDSDGILSENLKSENSIKIAVLSNGREKKDNTIWAFKDNTPVFLINSNGKTIKNFSCRMVKSCQEKKRKLKSVLYVKNAERNKILTKIGQQKNGNFLIAMNDVNVAENL